MAGAMVSTAAGARMPPKGAVRKMVSFTPEQWRVLDDLRFRLRIKTDQDLFLRLLRHGVEAEGERLPDDGDDDAPPESAPRRPRRRR